MPLPRAVWPLGQPPGATVRAHLHSEARAPAPEAEQATFAVTVADEVPGIPTIPAPFDGPVPGRVPGGWRPGLLRLLLRGLLPGLHPLLFRWSLPGLARLLLRWLLPGLDLLLLR